MANLTQQELKEFLTYDPETGLFHWARSSRRVRIGAPAGCPDVHGYGQINFGQGRVMKLHRLAWLYVHGEWPDGQIDHINHDRMDNRIANLRVVNNAENHRNRPPQKNNTTGIVGVSYDRRRFVAYINVDGVRHHLGRHKTAEAASLARVKAMQLFGFHENHGTGQSISKRTPTQHKPRQPFG